MKMSLSKLEEVLAKSDGVKVIPSGFVYIDGLWYNADLLLEKFYAQQGEPLSELPDDALEFFSEFGFRIVRIRTEPLENEYTPVTLNKPLGLSKSPGSHEISAIIRRKVVYRSQVEQLLQDFAERNVFFPIRKYYVEYTAKNGNVMRIPPKDIIALITGLDKGKGFIASEATRVMEKLGFSVLSQY